MCAPSKVPVLLSVALAVADVSAVLVRRPHEESAPSCQETDECNTEFVNSYGFLTAMDVRPSKPDNDAPRVDPDDYVGKIKNHSTVYVISSALGSFIKEVWPTIPRDISFVLVTGAAVTSLPYDTDGRLKSGGTHLKWSQHDFEDFINDTRIAHWFTQNCVARHPKLSAIPLGIDYRWLNRGVKSAAISQVHNPGHAWGQHQTPQQQEQTFLDVIRAQKPWAERMSAAYADFHLQMDSRPGKGSRKDALDELRRPEHKSSIHWATTRRDRVDIWKEYAAHKYVVAPLGVGLDCYRIWETLILGSIPIVPYSELVDDELFEDLPVQRVSTWAEVDVGEWSRSAPPVVVSPSAWNPQFSEKLTLEFWLRKIKRPRSRSRRLCTEGCSLGLQRPAKIILFSVEGQVLMPSRFRRRRGWIRLET
ncbi:unnamed protein product, partial [Prorocentrum cordatum]